MTEVHDQDMVSGERLVAGRVAAEILDVAPKTILRWGNSGLLRVVKIGRVHRYFLSDLKRHSKAA